VSEAVIIEVLEASSSRRRPVCAVFGACGGCQLQHLDRSVQLAVKVDVVRDCLRRIGGIDWLAPIQIDAGEEYGWRSRTELHVDAVSGRPGYFRSRSHEIVPIDDCPILVPSLRDWVRDPLPRASTSTNTTGALALAVGDDGRVARGAESVDQRVHGLDFRSRADAFWQGNRSLIETLVSRAVENEGGEIAIDLYAGAGLFSLSLARRFAAVHAVESDPACAALLSHNARANGIENLHPFASSVEAWLASGAAPTRPDLVLLDPPRAGASAAVIERLLEIEPGRIVYVSCDPATLARDLRLFLELGRGQGIGIESIDALDLFPQSYHVEVVARLALRPLSPRTDPS
jgi:23S rRNA (uracil1939-C5)-methyltransferase